MYFCLDCRTSTYVFNCNSNYMLVVFLRLVGEKSSQKWRLLLTNNYSEQLGKISNVKNFCRYTIKL